ncbi:hypothetical protein JRO89_XS03G0003100 [Xanthoceras sorbifolium]|uniref:Expansin-like EG45 domain-containing protein n=1 Tax=Xanthoceras sorbifolium TaxID=99658 RepID=A0ABQ8I852_9ROSI|nr:hypothetical protein JRO89_XS03G0003100 [Xanthoceras sorbifolium]
MAFQLINNSSIALFLLLILSLYSSASSVIQNIGTATFFKPPYTPSSCYGYEKKDQVMVAAATKILYSKGAACGQSYQVSCVGGETPEDNPCLGSGTVTVMITDVCPQDSCPTLNLSQDAFAAIANLDAGFIHISFTESVL